MVIETFRRMQCPNCGADVKHIRIEEGLLLLDEGIVDPEPVKLTNAGITYQLHECDKGGDTEC